MIETLLLVLIVECKEVTTYLELKQKFPKVAIYHVPDIESDIRIKFKDKNYYYNTTIDMLMPILNMEANRKQTTVAQLNTVPRFYQPRVVRC